MKSLQLENLCRFHCRKPQPTWEYIADEVIAFLRDHLRRKTPAWKRLKIVQCVKLIVAYGCGCVVGQKQTDHWHVAFRRGNMEWRIALIVGCIRICVMVEQDPSHELVFLFYNVVQSGAATVSHCVGIDAGIEKVC